MPDRPTQPGTPSRIAAWSVHALTASGAVWALLALDALSRERVDRALWWMALAVVVDGVDGALARRVRVKRVLPHIDGALLDNLVDYLNYVIVPACFLYRVIPLPAATAPGVATVVCLAGAFQFVRSGAKTDDRFLGFPSYWNVVVFYLLALEPPGVLALGIVAALVVLSFVPLPWVYPTRTRPWRVATLALTAVWAGLVGLLLWRFPHHPRWLALASLGYGVYYVALSAWLWHIPRRPAGSSGRPGIPF